MARIQPYPATKSTRMYNKETDQWPEVEINLSEYDQAAANELQHYWYCGLELNTKERNGGQVYYRHWNEVFQMIRV